MVTRLVSRFRAVRRARRWTVALALALCVAVTGVLVAWALTRAAPAWWAQAPPPDPVLGERVEHAAVAQLTVRRDADPAAAPGAWRSESWSVSLTSRDADAWLGSRLPKWLANQYPAFEWPRGVSRVGIAFRESVIHLGAQVTADGRTQVLGAELAPELRPDGSLWLTARRVTLGRLPIPAGWVLSESGYLPAGAEDDPVVGHVIAVLMGEIPLVMTPVVELDDGRRVRLVGLAAREGRLDITCVTEANP